jgi:uncharacterized membrane protein YkvA (DUF1232 family)
MRFAAAGPTPSFSREALQNAGRFTRGFWRKLNGVATSIPFAEDAVAAYYCALDRQTPARVRAALAGALAYFILPADAVPDLLPALGYTDDAAVLIATLQLVSSHLLPEHREAARRALERLYAKSGRA